MAQCAINPLSLLERATNATYIIEGEVLSQTSFWDNAGTHIYTANTIAPYKDFKGNINTKEVLILTKGGTVGDITETTTPSLSLQVGDMGLFFAQMSPLYDGKKTTSIPHLEPYGDIQGFIAYDPYTHTAIDISRLYKHIETAIYEPIVAQLGKPYRTIAALPQHDIAKAQQLLPAIASITPLTIRGGMRDTITISGTGFGTYAGVATIQFRNPNYYGLSVAYQSVPANHIVSWSDTQIRVIVPGRDIVLGTAGAGSGALRVKNSSDVVGQSLDEITVLYNKEVAGFAAVNMGNDNTTGGYTFRYSNGFNGNTAAKNALQRALQTWRCVALINMNTSSSTTTISCPGNDNINLISFDTNCTLPTGTLGQTTQWYASCTNGDKFFIEMDMLFSTAITWNYGPGATVASQKDFESIVLHELGHANGQGHVLDYGKLMYPSLASGIDIRSIDNDALTCTHIVLARSAQNNGCTGGSYVPNTGVCGIRAQVKVFLQGAYNTTTGLMSTELSGIIPTEQPFNRVPWLYDGTEISPTLPNNITDWVLVEARTTPNAAPIERKVALLRNDGILLAPDGSLGVPFANLTPYTPYYIVVRHRNHLAVMSQNAVSLPNALSFDFSKAANILGNNQAALMSDGKYALFAGDFFANGVISVLDFNLYATQVGSTPNQYLDSDCNLDKNVTINDFNQYRPNAIVIGIDPIRY